MKFTLIPIICAEDISSAFESIDSTVMAMYINKAFAENEKFKLKEIIMSYLKREAYVIDRDNPDSKPKINKRYEHRSIPS